MSELKPNQLVNLTIGRQAKVIEELGRGGQGIVYRVELDGKEWALKWYLESYLEILTDAKAFYENLAKNISNGAPSDAFLWPEFLTEKENGSFGYIMKLRPNGYYEFSNFILAKKQFTSFSTLLTAAMKICDGFERLHRRGLSYQDINNGNFFINPTNGNILICDNDNVMPQGQSFGMGGKMRYMAPEIVTGKDSPNKYSDRFSLAVVLFMLIYGNHPFEGARVLSCPCMTSVSERKYYGTQPMFLFDVTDNANRPVRGVHNNVINRWPMLPNILRETFTREFSYESLHNPIKRMVDSEWKRILQEVKDIMVVCPKCGEMTFVEDINSPICVECGRSFNVGGKIVFGNRDILLTQNTSFNLCSTYETDGIAFLDANSQLWIRNISAYTWTAETPSGKLRTVANGEEMPVRNGIKINVEQQKGELFKL